MDSSRIQAYLQAACAGLGFEIGEVWWVGGQHHGASNVPSYVDDRGGSPAGPSFVQLYTSKSFEDRRSMLVNPPEDEITHEPAPCTKSDLQKHVLSPRLVEAISENSQVVWANTRKTEGLTGRSDIPLHTAVGMPVAADANGNMCVVVMFSPNNIQSTDEALEFLNLISKSATSSTIPCLMPAFDNPEERQIKHLSLGSKPTNPFALVKGSGLGEGVTAKFVSITERAITTKAEPDIHGERNLSHAPKDCFGIPMLPSTSELQFSKPSPPIEAPSDAFDETTFGIWTTIMGNRDTYSPSPVYDLGFDANAPPPVDNGLSKLVDEVGSSIIDGESNSLNALAIRRSATISKARQDRLDEFCSAFLGMSVFDIADVWVPAGPTFPDSLSHVLSLSSTNSSPQIAKFKAASEGTLIKFWSGAVGRAFSSGNPVWSANPDNFVDEGRASYFYEAKIKTVLAVPIFYGKNVAPAGVVCCYSLVQSNSVPFVLRFVQQALRMLWAGLDKVEPHQSVGKDMWQDVAPADLGEMAADLEMQHHFISKKRPRSNSIAEPETSEPTMLTKRFDSSLDLRLIEPAPFAPNAAPAIQEINTDSYVSPVDRGVSFTDTTYGSPDIHDNGGFEHLTTNSQGTKRAHVMRQPAEPQPILFIQGSMALSMPNSLHSQVVQPQIGLSTQDATSSPTPILPSNHGQQSQSYPEMVTPTVVVSNHQPAGGNVPQSHAPAPAMFQVVNQSDFSGTNGSTTSNGQMVLAPNGNQTTPFVSQFCIPANMSAIAFTVPPPTKPCRIQGCDEPSVARRPYCIRHSGNRQCEHAGCNKCAQGSTRFCIAHGGGRRCTHPGCDKGARDKFFCAAHGGGKRCKIDGCKKSAVGGSSLCTAHGGGRRCAIDGCEKSAQSSTKYCVKHGGGKKCAHETCDKVARGRTLYCAAHGGGIRCKLEGCNRVAIGKQQLCRAHGGGSRRQKGSVAPEPEEHNTPSLVNSVLPSFSL